MKKLRAYLKNDESGQIMLEAVIIFPLVLLIIITMLSLGFLFYQRTMLSSVASETASAIGSCYKYDQALDEREITNGIVDNLRKYRMSLRLETMKEQNKNNGNKFVKSRIGLSNLGINRKDPQIESIDIVVDDVGRPHVTVSVSMETDFLFDDILKYLDIIDSSPKYTATSSAEIIDMTGYSSYVYFIKYFSKKAEDISKVVNICDDVYQTVNTVRSLFGIDK
ncbi:MAG: TadE/TadG family type IV pilus assembly protein [Candidatus Pseudoruminococcus sp.]|nr:pilus assembly protein [Ruminococcus sp.]MDY2782880.1 TadE/TadG family type IV pilus assembly protein [Candidatus Pseudoruminococcus sp.]